jgi:hypothetical protein
MALRGDDGADHGWRRSIMIMIMTASAIDRDHDRLFCTD